MFDAKQKQVHHYEQSWPRRPKGVRMLTYIFCFTTHPATPDVFCIIEARSSMTLTNRDLCHGEKNKLPMILFSTCFKRWAPQETRQNEGSSHAILGKKWSFVSISFWPSNYGGFGHLFNWPHLKWHGLAKYLFTKMWMANRPLFGSVHFVRVERCKTIRRSGDLRSKKQHVQRVEFLSNTSIKFLKCHISHSMVILGVPQLKQRQDGLVNQWLFDEYSWITVISHRIHGAGIFTDIWLIFMVS